MEFLALMGLILFVGIIAGCITSFVSLGSIKKLKQQVASLTKSVTKQSADIKKLNRMLAELTPVNPDSVTSSLEASASSESVSEQVSENVSNEKEPNEKVPNTNITVSDDTVESSQEPSSSHHLQDDQPDSVSSSLTRSATHSTPSLKANQPLKSAQTTTNNTEKRAVNNPTNKTLVDVISRFDLETFLAGNGLFWIGAVILSLGGVFLAKYSIEAGLIPPYLRILAGALFGVGLIGAAEYLHQNPTRFQIQSEMVSGALASAGVITCYAMTLVAFDFYSYLPPLIAFIILAIISLCAIALAIRYGPILAAIGLVGAYIVPALVSTGSNNIFALLSYVAFVSVSVVWVFEIVKKQWLWWMSVAGHFLWLLIAISLSEIADITAIVGFSIISVYLFTLVPILGWQCQICNTQAMPIKLLLIPRKEQIGIATSFCAVIIFYLIHGFDNSLYVVMGVLSVILFVIPVRHSAFDTWPFLSLILALFILVSAPQHTDFNHNLFPFSGVLLFVQVSSLLLTVYSVIVLRLFPNRHSYLLLLVLAPLTLYGLSYAIYPTLAGTFLYTVWALQLLMYAVLFIVVGMKSQYTFHKASCLMLSNGAMALILTMLLHAGTLTMALCIQIAVISLVSKKYALNLPAWILKIATAILLVRFTFAPWLASYSSQQILGIHWSAVVYPVAFLCFYIAKRYQNPKLHLWFDGAMLHIAALFVTTETSYYLQGRYINLEALTWHESVLLGMNWLILAAVYMWRRQHTTLKNLYAGFAALLCLGAVKMHLTVTVFENPFFTQQSLGGNNVFNWLIPLWAMPAAILLTTLYFKLVETELRRPLWILCGIFSVLYINAVIRLCFHDDISFLVHDVTQSELYTYSLVWLAIAAGTIITAQKRSLTNLNKMGFIILTVVVLKAFLIDIPNLNGLFKAMSFIGLGLSLVAIGWLFQRFKNKTISM